VLSKDLAVLLLLGLVGSIFGGSVRRDPATGKWIEMTGDSDRGARDRRAGGGGGGDDFFGGFDFVDSRGSEPTLLQSELVPSNLNPLTPSLTTKDYSSKKSKFTKEIPIVRSDFDTSDLVQLSTSATPGKSNPAQPTEIERVSHPFIEQQTQVQVSARAQPLQPRSLGNVCRFGGYAPISGCPSEANNGCVDRIPCTRKCANGGYFSWRCRGPLILSLKEANEQLTVAQEKAQPPTPQQTADNSKAISELANRLELALKNNDYTSLARTMIEAQSGGGARMNLAALMQTAAQAQNEQQQQQQQEQQQDQTEQQELPQIQQEQQEQQQDQQPELQERDETN